VNILKGFFWQLTCGGSLIEIAGDEWLEINIGSDSPVGATECEGAMLALRDDDRDNVAGGRDGKESWLAASEELTWWIMFPGVGGVVVGTGGVGADRGDSKNWCSGWRPWRPFMDRGVESFFRTNGDAGTNDGESALFWREECTELSGAGLLLLARTWIYSSEGRY
jgi:hypothetical protein